MKYRCFLWDGTCNAFTNKQEAIKWIKNQMQSWMEKGDRLVTEELTNGIGYFIQENTGEFTDAWARLRILARSGLPYNNTSQ